MFHGWETEVQGHIACWRPSQDPDTERGSGSRTLLWASPSLGLSFLFCSQLHSSHTETRAQRRQGLVRGHSAG